MKICHIILTNNFAGSEKYTIDLANQQSYLGHEVLLIIKKQNKKISIKDHISNDVNYIEIGNFFKTYSIKKILKKFEIQIVHCHLGNSCKILKNIKIPKIVTLHIDYKKKEHDHMNGIICINKNQFEKINHLKTNKKLILNWLPKIECVDESYVSILKKKHNTKNYHYTFGYFGRFDQSKNLDLLVNSFIELKLNGSKLILIGDGDQKKNLLNIAHNHPDIEFLSSQKDIYPYYSIIDCFVLPSKFEPFGLVILESMFFKKDIILSKVPIANYLPQNLSFEIGDKNHLKRLMLYNYKKGKSNLDYDLTKFDRNIKINKVLNFYKFVLENYVNANFL